MPVDWVGNFNSIYKTIGASNHTKEERENNDFYATDPDTIKSLLKKITLNKNLWEPAAGEGHLAKELEKNGIFTGSSAVAYAWFVWIKGYNDKPRIDWI